jgi:hypothetical protein
MKKAKSIRIVICFLGVLFVFLRFNHAIADDIYYPPKIIKKTGTNVLISGRWKKTTEKGSSIMPEINTTKIRCNIKDMSCTEIIAKLMTLKDHELFKRSKFWIDEFRYNILLWKDNTILAKREALVANVNINILIDE